MEQALERKDFAKEANSNFNALSPSEPFEGSVISLEIYLETFLEIDF